MKTTRRTFLKSLGLGVAALAAPGCTGALSSRQTASTAQPNIIVILADDMGFSDLGCYGSEIDTPHLNELAANGLRFTQFYNAARCCPTRASILTGLYPHQAGIGHMVADQGYPSYQGRLHDRCVTLAEALKPAGYTTLAVGKWHVGSAPGHWPLDRGFDRFWGTPSGGGVYFKDALEIRKEVFFVNGSERVEPPDDMYVTDTFTQHAMEFVEEAVTQTKQPFFLYLAHIAPHWPLQAKPADIARYAGKYDIGWDAVREKRFARQKEMGLFPRDTVLSPRDPQAKAWSEMPEEAQRELARRGEIYAAQIDCIDQNVGRLVAKLKELGQFDNTLILFLSDNGCSAEGGPGGFSRGRPDAPLGTGLSYASAGLEWANASDTPFRRFKMDTYEGGIATPLIAHWPKGIASRRFVRQPGHIIDIMPTLLDVAGAEYPSHVAGRSIMPTEGRSLTPLFKGGKREDHGALFWEHQGNRAVRQGKWKLVAAHKGPWELYDLEADRTELHDLSEKSPEKVREMKTLYENWAARCGVQPWPVKKQTRN
jgi:arylsulfatase